MNRKLLDDPTALYRRGFFLEDDLDRHQSSLVKRLVAAHVHAFDLRGIESKEGEELLRTRAYDTFIHSPK